MSKKRSDTVTLSAAIEDANTIKQLDSLFSEGTFQLKLVDSNGEEILLPESVYEALRQVVSVMASRQAISIAPQERQLTTQAAADILNVSRPYLVKLLDTGEIPCFKVGSHRRVYFHDLLDYKNKRDKERRLNLDKLTEFLQDEGCYDYENDTGKSFIFSETDY